MTGPVSPEAMDELATDLLDVNLLDDAGVEAPEPVPSPEAQPEPVAETPPPDKQTETTATSPPAKDAGPAPVVDPPKPTEPSGEPFTLRVDRQAVPIDGAIQMPDGEIRFRPEAWRKVSGNFIADRQGFQQRERALQVQVQQAQAGKGDEELKFRALNAELGAVMDKGPEAVAQWLDNFLVNRPVLEARRDARVAQEKLAAYTQREQAQTTEQQQQQIVADCQNHLDLAFDTYLADPKYKLLASDKTAVQQLKQNVWDDYAESLFWEDESGRHFRQDRFERLLDRENAQRQHVAQTTTKIQEAAKRNAAAIAPTKPIAKPAKPRAANGQFVQPEEFDADDWLRSKKFTE